MGSNPTADKISFPVLAVEILGTKYLYRFEKPYLLGGTTVGDESSQRLLIADTTFNACRATHIVIFGNNETIPTGFEPVRAEPIGVQVQLLNLSDTVPVPLVFDG